MLVYANQRKLAEAPGTAGRHLFVRSGFSGDMSLAAPSMWPCSARPSVFTAALRKS